VFTRRLLPYFQGETLKARLARGAVAAFAVNAAGLGLTLLMHLVLARTLGPEGLGVYAYVLAWVMILVLAAKLGLEQTLLRFVADYCAREDWHLVRAVIRYAERRIILLGAAVAGAGAVAVLALADQTSDTLTRTFLAGLAMIPPLALLQTRSSVARGLGLVASALLPYAVIRPATVIVVVGLYAWWSLSLGPVFAMLATVLGTVLGLAVITVKIRSMLPRNVSGQLPAADVHREWRVTMLPLLLLAAFQQVLNQTDVLMLGWFTDSADIGIYSVASRAAQASAFALTAINTIFAPTISVLYGRGNIAGLQEVVTTAAWWSLASTLAFAVPMFVLAGPLLGIFGASFVGGDTALRILLVGQVVGAGLGSVMYIMTMTGQERPAMFILGAILAANLVLNLALIPTFGIEGAAAAKAITLIAWKMAMAIAIWRRIRIVPSLFG
jgi:O-antigen/teichoic acid export membrane protein